MKKLLSLGVLTICSVALVACSGNNNSSEDKKEEQATSEKKKAAPILKTIP